MKLSRLLLLSVACLTLPSLAAASETGPLEVRFQPGDVLYVYPNQGPGSRADFYTAVIHNVAFLNHDDTPITLKSARFNVERSGERVQTVVIDHQTLEESAVKFRIYKDRGLLEAYDSHFQTSRYLDGVTISGSTTIEPGAAVVVLQQVLLFQKLPDVVSVTIDGRTEAGEPVSGSGSLKVVLHASTNDYWFPVQGRWVASAAPSLHSHHRWASIQEFALDLIQYGAGGLSHRDDGTELVQFYAYGEPVYAIGDGVVVSVRADQTESDQNLQQPGESSEAYYQRTLEDQQKRLAKGFEYLLGNHVVIRHANDEYSHYLHLKHGSVNVTKGAQVRRGQQIGSVGHSGNSTEPHLHFHVTDGPSVVYSRSIPVTFSNITLWPDDDGAIDYLNSGQVVIAKAP